MAHPCAQPLAWDVGHPIESKVGIWSRATLCCLRRNRYHMQSPYNKLRQATHIPCISPHCLHNMRTHCVIIILAVIWWSHYIYWIQTSWPKVIKCTGPNIMTGSQVKINVPTYCVKNATHGLASVQKRSETGPVWPWTGSVWSRTRNWTGSNSNNKGLSWCCFPCRERRRQMHCIKL